MFIKQQTKKCPYCVEEINVEAIKCKYCGEMISKKETVERKKNNFASAGCLIVIILFVIIFISGCSSFDDSGNIINDSEKRLSVEDMPISESNKYKNINTSMASIQAQAYIKKALKSPSTAKFPGLWKLINDGVVAYEKETNRYEIVSYVDSQNSFGATIRSNWSVVLKYLGGDDSDIRNWQLKRMIIDNKIIYPIQE